MNPEIHGNALNLSSRAAENDMNGGLVQETEVDKGFLHTRQGQVEILR
jgi:hypothetical protein